MQFYGECWSGEHSKQTFAMYGESDQCYQGVGRQDTNAVYRLENMPGKFLSVMPKARLKKVYVQKGHSIAYPSYPGGS